MLTINTPRGRIRTFGQTLFPTDGSEGAQTAVDLAIDLAETHGATLHALFIVDQATTISGTGEGVAGLDNLLDAFENEWEEVTGDVVAPAPDRGIEARAAVRRGNPHDDILGYVQEQDVHLIVWRPTGEPASSARCLAALPRTSFVTPRSP